jgi:hypothetical protein
VKYILGLILALFINVVGLKLIEADNPVGGPVQALACSIAFIAGRGKGWEDRCRS